VIWIAVLSVSRLACGIEQLAAASEEVLKDFIGILTCANNVDRNHGFLKQD